MASLAISFRQSRQAFCFDSLLHCDLFLVVYSTLNLLYSGEMCYINIRLIIIPMPRQTVY